MDRVSTSYWSTQGLGVIQARAGKIANLQAQLSSGKKLLNASDDPIGTSQALLIDGELKFNERFSLNAQEGLSELAIADSTIQGIVDSVQRARELAVQASNDTYGQSQLDAFGTEIDSLITSIVQQGNASFAGKSIFGGFKTDTAAFTLDATTGSVTYNGSSNASLDDYQREIQVGPFEKIGLNVNGLDLLGSVTVTGAQTTTGTGILKTLRQLVLDIKAGDKTAIRASLDNIDTNMGDILNAAAKVGAKTNQLELTVSRLDDQRISYNQMKSSIESADFADIISQLTLEQSVYQNSLYAIKQISQQSILNYM